MPDEIKDLDLLIKSKDDEINKLKAELKEIKYKFNEAEQIANFGFWEVDPETMDPTWTDGIFKITGLDPEDGQIKYFEQKKIIHPDDWEYFYQALIKVLETGFDNEIDVRFIKPDGSIHVLHVIGKPKKGENGRILGVRGTAQDITELKNIETRLKDSEAFYRTLFENTGTATIIVDENTTIIMANSQFEKLSGYSKTEIEGRLSWKKIVSKELLELTKNYHKMRRKGLEKPPTIYEAKLVDKEGISKYILVNVSMIPGTKRSIASLTDLTEMKKAEELLQTTLKRFYTILGNIRASILLVTDNDEVEFLNNSFCEYFGLPGSPDDYCGIKASEMIEKIDEAYNMPHKEIKRITDIVKKWKPVIGEEIEMKGSRTCLRDFIPISVNNKPYGRLWLHLDITERKKFEKRLEDSEKRYKYIVEKATAGMFILDDQGMIKYLNEHMAQMLHYSKDEMLDMEIKNFVDEGAEFYRYRQPFEVQVERYNWFKILDRDGNVYWSNLTISPIFNNEKEYVGCLGIVTDINMQKGLEEAYLEREEIFTRIIYDMMEMLNKMANYKSNENSTTQNIESDLSNN